MKKVFGKSVIPIYLFAFFWLIYSIAFPLYALWHFLIAAALSAAVYIVSSILISKRMPDAEIIIKTGIPQADAILSAGRMYTAELGKLNAAIDNSSITNNVKAIIAKSERMFVSVSKNPDLIVKLNPFTDYYFPLLIKFLDSYIELTSEPQAGDVVMAMREKITGVTDTIKKAFDNASDAMFADKALDLSADIEALKQIIVSEGLG